MKLPELTTRDRDIDLRVTQPNGSVNLVTLGKDGSARTKAKNVDAAGEMVTGGMVDLQVNGFAGIDFNSPGLSPDMIDHALTSMLSCGTTRCLPTLITGPVERMAAQLAELDKAVAASKLGPLMVPGYHLEGPFLSPLEGYHGAHNPDYMVTASPERADKLLAACTFRPVALWTVAPEIEGVLNMIETYTTQGISFSIGHSAANGEQVDLAAFAGAKMSTHLGNALPEMLPKRDNTLLAQLACDKLAASFIADGIHLPKPFLQTCLRAKGLNRSILVTDAVSCAGPHVGPGTYTTGEIELIRDEDGLVHKPGETKSSGSSASMDCLAANVSSWYGFSLSEVAAVTRGNQMLTLIDKANQGLPEHAEAIEWSFSGSAVSISTAILGQWKLDI